MKKQGKTKWIMAKAGEYDWAFEVLPAVKDQNNPDVLNMLGYSYCREKNTKTYAG